MARVATVQQYWRLNVFAPVSRGHFLGILSRSAPSGTTLGLVRSIEAPADG